MDLHPLTYRRLCLDLPGAVFFCCKLRMLITIANVPLMHPQMLQMASNLFTVSPPFMSILYHGIPWMSMLFLQSFFIYPNFLFVYIEI